jgi:hypothetical protein
VKSHFIKFNLLSVIEEAGAWLMAGGFVIGILWLAGIIF